MRHSVRTGTTAALVALALGALTVPQTASATASAAAPATTVAPVAGSVRLSALAGGAGVAAERLRIRAAHSDKCVDVEGASGANSANVFQWSCLSSTQYNQQWSLEPAAAGVFRLRAVHSGKCMDVAGAGLGDGANVFQWDCLADPARNQRWYVTNERIQNGRYTYNIIAQHSGKCLDVAGASTANGANVFQWKCLGAGALNQQWTFFIV
ncbi:RICIN domain-containing protein [Streptomyces sp. NPDC097619]|uniref:RICIN domain-containing protein n=1 Tax=Streptomyces sp. NPDC097619 TaxID=3157228 RepID=UPI003333B37C